MQNLQELPGFTPAALRLLTAAGVEDVRTLANSQPAELLERLFKAHRADRDGADTEPTAAEVTRWISDAKARLSLGANASAGKGLAEVPEAIVLPPEPTNIRSREAPPRFTQPVPRSQARGFAREFRAELNRAGSPPPPKEKLGRKEPLPAETLVTAKKVPLKPPITASQEAGRLPHAEVKEWASVDRDSFRSTTDEVVQTTAAPAAEEEEMEDDEDELVRKTVKLPAGTPLPRRVVRGVPHPRKWRIWLSSLVVLFHRVALVAVVLGSLVLLPLAFLSGEDGRSWMFLLLGILITWAFSAMLYLCLALRLRCRICTNQIFVNKRCTKNPKAHSLWGLGLTGSLALHALLFGWFRCMYCGTAVRLRYSPEDDEQRGRKRR